VNNTIAGITITHPEKIFFPDAKVTKLQLAQYYAAVSSRMLPYIKNRPLNILRCPNGIQQQCFLQRHLSEKSPPALKKIKMRINQENFIGFTVENQAGLISLVQLGSVEIHCWGETYPRIGFPDQIVFDLDPPEKINWTALVNTAKLLRKVLADFKLKSFVKTTGGKGLHVVVPIKPIYSWEQIHAFSKALAETLVKMQPDKLIATATKSKRQNKIFIDYLRNSQVASAVAPYAVRARKGAPVAMPLAWAELSKISAANHFTVKNCAKQLAKKDPWQDFFKLEQTLSVRILEKLSML
jgi:bifunctional non-homologous end joining protein LigD